MKTYKEYFLECRQNYQKENPGSKIPDASVLYNFGFDSVEPMGSSSILTLDNNYQKIVETVAEDIGPKFKDRKLTWFPPGLDEGKDFAIRLKNVWDIGGLEDLCNIILPQIEEKLFGSYVLLDAIYAYQTQHKNAPLRSSWIWHYDNHPREVIKVMVYLTDVDNTCGPFEVIHNSTGAAVKVETHRVDHTKWQSNSSRVQQDQISQLQEQGFAPRQILGQKGTTTIFDNNIIHRAGIPEEGNHRSVVVFMIRPTLHRLAPYIDRAYTGTNYHADTHKNPSHIGVK